MQIEFTISGLKPTQRRRIELVKEHRAVAPAVETIVLAYQIEQAVRDGRARDFAEVTKQIGMTRARVSQIMRLLRLPPEIIETLLFVDPIRYMKLTERKLRLLIGATAPSEIEDIEL